MECLKLSFACTFRCSGLPPECPGSLATSALAALLRPVSVYALAFSSPLSISGVLGDGALRRSFNPADVLPSCPAELGSWNPSSVLLPFQTNLPRLFLWLLSPRAPSNGGTLHTGARPQRSRPVPRSVVLHVPALLLALLTGPMISLLSGR